MDQSKYNQHVSAFKKQECIILVSNIKSKQGLWYLQDPITSLELRKPTADIGLLVANALSTSSYSALAPPTESELMTTMNNLFQAANVQSFAQLLHHTKHCGVGCHEKGIEITPTHNSKANKETNGLRFLFEKRILIDPDSSPEKLGSALLQGFDACSSA